MVRTLTSPQDELQLRCSREKMHYRLRQQYEMVYTFRLQAGVVASPAHLPLECWGLVARPRFYRCLQETNHTRLSRVAESRGCVFTIYINTLDVQLFMRRKRNASCSPVSCVHQLEAFRRKVVLCFFPFPLIHIYFTSPASK